MNSKDLEILISKAKLGSAVAQRQLADYYYHLDTSELSRREAIRWYKSAADQGDGRAKYILDNMGEYEPPAKDSNGQDMGSLLTDANQGDAHAQYGIGLMYEDGKGVNQSYGEAVRWYRMAADLNYPDAQCKLGTFYENGTSVKKSKKEAIRWYRMAASNGDETARKSLDRLSESDKPVKKSRDETGSANTSALNAIDPDDVYPPCDYVKKYDLGKGAKPSDEEVFRHYRTLAGANGDAEDKTVLGFLYAKGIGVEQQYEDAIEMFRSAADQGNPVAQFDLGVMFMNGLGVEQSYVDAAIQFKMAADQGNPVAHFNLAILYGNGLGVKWSYDQAVKWLNSAEALGYTEAWKHSDRLKRYDPNPPTNQSVNEGKENKKASGRGNAGNKHASGNKSQKGQDTRLSKEEVAKWYGSAMDQGFEIAQGGLSY